MIFDHARYRDLRTRHGVYTSAVLAINGYWWFIGWAIVGVLIGVLT